MNSLNSFIFGILLLAATPIIAQDKLASSTPEVISEESSPVSFFEYIIRDSISKVTVTADFNALRLNRYIEEYYPGQLVLKKGDTLLQELPVSFRARGNSRKKLCFYPSLKIKLSKKALKKQGFNKDNKYKLVCQCRSGKVHQQSLLREFLAYKIFNLISPYSYRAHLLEVDYIQVSKSRKKRHFAFILESKKSLEERLDGEIVDRDGIVLDKISREESIRMSLFQYLIANTDWEIPALHNIKLLLENDGNLVPIPYDYDYSGLADSPYATPNADYPIKKHTDRYFISDNYTEAEIDKQLVYFLEQEEAIKSMIREADFLRRSSKRFVKRYINEFYRIIENERRRRWALITIPNRN